MSTAAAPCGGRCGALPVGLAWPGVDARYTLVRTADDVMPAYVARPRGGGAAPVVLLVQEVFGLDRHARDAAQRLAARGHFVVVPDLFVRQGDPSMFESEHDLRTKLAVRVPDAQALDDLDAALAWAAANGGDAGRLGVAGFCWGGRIAWLYAAHQPRVKAAVAWCGRLDGPRSEIAPAQPIDVIDRLKAPVLGLYGGDDKPAALAATQRFAAALAQAGSASAVHEYAGVPHAFYAQYRGSFREDAAEDGWARALAWLDRHGAGPRLAC